MSDINIRIKIGTECCEDYELCCNMCCNKL